MSRKLKSEIAKVEQEMTGLEEVLVRIERGDTPEKIKAEMDVLAKVRDRLAAALPAESVDKPERKKRAAKGLPKPNGKAKEASA